MSIFRLPFVTEPAPLARRLLMFGPVSGGHVNPVVSFVDVSFGGFRRRDALAYLPAQVTGCVLGAMAANAMFGKALISISTHPAPPPHTCSPRSSPRSD